MLIAAYLKLKSKPGMMSPGVDEETLDGINTDWFEKQEKSLRNETYQPKPVRREYIPKPNGKKRPLGISSPRDRIVQQAMKMVMELKLDPEFLDCSHGFRPKRSCHTALREIRNWKGVTWFIEGDIKAFFDNIDHNIIANLISNHFKDTQLTNLYWKMVKAGYMEWDHRKYKYVPSEVGVPQGGIVSPLLSNLILNELDQFVSAKINEFNSQVVGKKKHLTNPKYMSWGRKVKLLREKLKLEMKGSNTHKNIKKEIRKALNTQKRLSSMAIHPDSRPTIKYVRYADDWIIGVWGNRAFASKIKEEIKEKLETLKLTLSDEKTLITNARSGEAKFLGTRIKKNASNRSEIFSKCKLKKRIPGGNIRMSAPIKEIIKKLEAKGFLENASGEWKMKSIWKFLALPMKDIILRYRAIYNGFNNYYSFVDNKKLMSKIYWILKISLRKTLCRKFNIGKNGLIQKYGPNFTCNFHTTAGVSKTVDFEFPKPVRNPMDFKTGGYTFRDPLYAGLWTVRTVSNIGETCSSCGADSDIEMHHLKHIKTINVKLNSFDQMLAKINRKQVPLCSSCHHKVHSGEYKGNTLSRKNKQTE